MLNDCARRNGALRTVSHVLKPGRARGLDFDTDARKTGGEETLAANSQSSQLGPAL